MSELVIFQLINKDLPPKKLHIMNRRLLIFPYFVGLFYIQQFPGVMSLPEHNFLVIFSNTKKTSKTDITVGNGTKYVTHSILTVVFFLKRKRKIDFPAYKNTIQIKPQEIHVTFCVFCSFCEEIQSTMNSTRH